MATTNVNKTRIRKDLRMVTPLRLAAMTVQTLAEANFRYQYSGLRLRPANRSPSESGYWYYRWAVQGVAPPVRSDCGFQEIAHRALSGLRHRTAISRVFQSKEPAFVEPVAQMRNQHYSKVIRPEPVTGIHRETAKFLQTRKKNDLV